MLCGDAAGTPEAARAAGLFGCYAFVVADACWSGEGAAALTGADLKIVDCASALAAAAVAKARQRREAQRRGVGRRLPGSGA